MTDKPLFQFDGSYNNRAQVAEYLDAFSVVYAEIRATGKYTYNSSFKGRIVGLSAATPKDEDTAIYLLQSLHAIREEARELEKLLADGYVDLITIPARKRFAAVVVYRAGHFVGGTGLTLQFTDARIFPDADAKPRILMEKNKRKYGHSLAGVRVLVKESFPVVEGA